ncbi:peroxide stress protein YaaA, partial [Pseudomonas aeruginosa]|nr:peroxide stress protein YaaA [Pseudomonas aeruginosa]MCS9412776.1 peroxide stress protein YaaA [Pseudomonas aeruginosa]
MSVRISVESLSGCAWNGCPSQRGIRNLASNEYFGAVKRKALQARVIDTEFKDLKNGQYKIISFYAKKARGMMARYVIRERLRDPAGLKDFNAHGYYFSAEQSGPDQLVFLRDAPQD